MNQIQRRIFLINSLIKEQPQYKGIRIPRDEDGQRQLLRSLLNVRRPGAVSDAFLEVQDEYLLEETVAKGITHLADLSPLRTASICGRGTSPPCAVTPS